jgi:CelD/BcsL family acetyltransferase involved in cellulose biosynthesis
LEPDRYEIVTDTAGFLALQPGWDDLHARSSERRFSQSFLWCLKSWQAVEEPRGRTLFCIVARNGKRPVLIWPFVRYRRGLWSVATQLGCAYAEYMGPLVEESGEADQRILDAWRELKKRCDCHIIEMSSVASESSLHNLVANETAGQVREITPSFAVEWSGIQDWNDYLESLHGDNRRKQSARNRRRLEKMGSLVFSAIEGGDAAAQVVDWILPRKVEQLAVAGQRGPWLETEAYRNLLTSVACGSSPAGSILTFTLNLNDQIIAALMSRVDTRRIEMMNTVFESEYGKYGPGQILMEECLKWALERRLDFDMRIGDYPYKRSWANSEREIIGYEFVNSRLGRGYSLYLRLVLCLHRVKRLMPAPARRRAKILLRSALLGKRP